MKKERKITNKNVKSRSILLYLSSIKIPKLAKAGKRGSILLHKVWSKRRRKCSVKRPEVLFSLCVKKRYFVHYNWYFPLILYVMYYLIWKPIQNGQRFRKIPSILFHWFWHSVNIVHLNARNVSAILNIPFSFLLQFTPS